MRVCVYRRFFQQKFRFIRNGQSKITCYRRFSKALRVSVKIYSKTACVRKYFVSENRVRFTNYQNYYRDFIVDYFFFFFTLNWTKITIHYSRLFFINSFKCHNTILIFDQIVFYSFVLNLAWKIYDYVTRAFFSWRSTPGFF